jgi:phenylalanyl-tRNA synthetase alpha chain
MPYLTEAQLARALTLADLTDPAYGPHCMQQIVAGATGALHERWGCPVLVHRAERVLPVADNYDALGYPPDGPARDSRYTRYVDAGRLLRSQTSAAVPSALRTLAPTAPADVLVCAPGLVYRRDAIDRLHVGEPHQLDLWRITERAMAPVDLEAMIAAVVDALLPGARWRARPASHPYTEGGREVEVLADGGWVELLECGLAHPRVLAAGGLGGHSGLAMGIGLDRAVMLRKGIDDIRLLRSDDPRVAAQMRDLSAYREVSAQPPARRDMSIACAPGRTDEDLGDRVRGALSAEQAEWVEEVGVAARTPARELPPSARERIGIADDQENLLVRVVLRHPTRSLAKAQANALRDRIYAALHEGSSHEWATPPAGARAASRPSRRRSGSR